LGSNPIYLDFNATTPIDPRVAEAMLPYLYEHFGNPSSAHPLGLRARAAVEEARARVADLLGCAPGTLVLTGGGTESNNTVIRGVADALRGRGRHLVISAVEHPAVSAPAARLRASGFEISVVPVDSQGLVDPSDVARAIRPDTILVSVMHANNEVGTIQPIAEIAAVARERGVRVHTDAAQTVGKIRVRTDELGVDYLSVAGHKMYAPKGVGALFIRSGAEPPKLLDGAGHEGGRRAGTENVLGIVGLGAAASVAAERLPLESEHCRAMRDRLFMRLSETLDVRLNGHPERRLPNTLSVALAGVDAHRLLSEVGREVAASAGAACHSDGRVRSAVLEAMGVPADLAAGTIRFSTGRTTTPDDVDRAAAAVASAVRRLGR
jgi:cysteine desulfurase